MASAEFREFVRQAKTETGLPYREMARRAGVPEGRFSDYMARPGYNLSPVDQAKIRRVINEAQEATGTEVVQLRPGDGADPGALSQPRLEDIAADLMEEVRDARRERTEIQDELHGLREAHDSLARELRGQHDALVLRVGALEAQRRQQQA